MLLLGAAGLWWSSIVLPIFRSAAPAREITERIMTDQRFKAGTLRHVLLQMEREPQRPVVQSSFVRAKALVELRAAEEAVGRKSSEEADAEIAAAEQTVHASLALNPTDSFLWLMLYSVRTAREGFAPENVRYFEQSYSSGLHEGWIVLRRNRLALSVFPMLTTSIQARVVSEFAEMVDLGFVDEAVVNLTDVGWPHRERLLASLEQVDIAARELLARQLSRNSVKVVVPGIEMKDRPW
ncbi:hypothetical protein [Bradyrhizobium sp. BR 1432]|uniref:hypothetical protein n=1 Tax=Bradyrhizobium sp. BR 1432 TaxID=3447966 RepID=UPI003EE654D2